MTFSPSTISLLTRMVEAAIMTLVDHEDRHGECIGTMEGDSFVGAVEVNGMAYRLEIERAAGYAVPTGILLGTTFSLSGEGWKFRIHKIRLVTMDQTRVLEMENSEEIERAAVDLLLAAPN